MLLRHKRSRRSRRCLQWTQVRHLCSGLLHEPRFSRALSVLHRPCSRVSGPPVQLPPVQQPARTRRGKAPEDGAAAKGAAVGALHEEEVAVPPRQESASSAPPDDADTTEPPAPPDAAVVRLLVRATHRSFLTCSASQVALSGPVVPPTEDVSVQPHSAAANTRAADVVAEPASEQPQVRCPKCIVVCFRHDLHAYRTCVVSPG